MSLRLALLLAAGIVFGEASIAWSSTKCTQSGPGANGCATATAASLPDAEADDGVALSFLQHGVVAAHVPATLGGVNWLGADRAVQEVHAAARGATWNYYDYSFIPMAALALFVAFYTMPKTNKTNEDHAVTDEFKQFRLIFIVVWALATGADWLQGPYVYSLYEGYGYSDNEISQLFVAGFGSAMIFGVFAGAIADSVGRKRCAVAYCVLYIVSCMTKHFNSFPALLVGRITGGIATSLLFSTFECWMIAEHNRHDFGVALLRYMFSLMYLVNYIVATSSGLLAQASVVITPLTKFGPPNLQLYYGGNLFPFDLSILVLLAAIPLICLLWEENYGGESGQKVVDSLVAALGEFGSSWKVCMLGVAVSSFEGSMYYFVLKWTPALEASSTPCPHGLVFSVFMMACMCGSSLFSFFDPSVHPSKVLGAVLLLSAGLFASLSQWVGKAGMVHMVYVAFVVFEACVGIYFPSMGALKSEIVPERARAGVYTAFRIPLNVVVSAITLTNLSDKVAFMMCAMLLLVAFTAVGLIAIFAERRPGSHTTSPAGSKVPPTISSLQDEKEVPTGEKALMGR